MGDHNAYTGSIASNSQLFKNTAVTGYQLEELQAFPWEGQVERREWELLLWPSFGKDA